MSSVDDNYGRDRAANLMRKIIGAHHTALEMDFIDTCSMLEIVTSTLARDIAAAMEEKRVDRVG